MTAPKSLARPGRSGSDRLYDDTRYPDWLSLRASRLPRYPFAPVIRIRISVLFAGAAELMHHVDNVVQMIALRPG